MTKNIAIACFIGGALCTAVALLVSPNLWWLGLLAGFAAGYLCCDFLEFVTAVPEAVERTRDVDYVPVHRRLLARLASLGRGVKWVLSLPPVHIYLAGTVALTMFFKLMVMPDLPSGIISIVWWTLATILGSCSMAVWSAISFVVFMTLQGRAGDNSWLRPTPPPTYGGTLFILAAAWLELIGLLCMLIICSPYYLARGAWRLGRKIGTFLWHLFKLIHSEKRLLCAIDGTLGGAVSYIYFGSTATSVPEQITTVLFGGLIGAALGVANWEIVSKRILHLDETTSST